MPLRPRTVGGRAAWAVAAGGDPSPVTPGVRVWLALAVRPADLAAISELASGQDGLVGIDQALELGLTRRQLDRARRDGLVERLHPGVLRLTAAPASRRQLVRGGVLQTSPHGRATHESALALRGVTHVPFSVVVTVPPAARHQHRGIRVHRHDDLADEHCAEVHGIPTTTVERAVVDVSCVLSTAHLEDLVDRLTITARRTSIGALQRTLRQVNRRGRAGIGRMVEVLDRRRPADPTPRSRLERLADDVLAGAGLPRPQHEYPLPGTPPGAGMVDRAWPEALLILEVDGRPWHARERDMARDRARDRAAAGAGWVTLRVLDEEVVAVPDLVRADVVTTYRTRMGQLVSFSDVPVPPT